MRERVQARREPEDAHARTREPVQDPGGSDEAREEWVGAQLEDPILLPVRRLQQKQTAQEIQGVEIGGMREEPLQAESLPEDVFVQSVQEEELRGFGRPEEPSQALRGIQMAVHVRDHVFTEG